MKQLKKIDEKINIDIFISFKRIETFQRNFQVRCVLFLENSVLQKPQVDLNSPAFLESKTTGKISSKKSWLL